MMVIIIKICEGMLLFNKKKSNISDRSNPNRIIIVPMILIKFSFFARILIRMITIVYSDLDNDVYKKGLMIY